MKFTILRFDSIDSTNSEALKQARVGADEGLCIIAKQQTAGRGRQGRAWISPKDSGLYVSVVLRPQLGAKYLSLITLAAAIAVFDMLTEMGLAPDIKWPNDLLVSEKKICGILAETTESDKGFAVVVGIGINVKSTNFPAELLTSTTSLETERGRTGTFFEREQLLLKYFDHWYCRLIESDGPKTIVDAWSKRSTYASGKAVRATLSNEAITGVTDGLEPNGALRIKTADGRLNIVQAGDVERLRT
jgi:BirA family biotin operon repressor/biotin-[acetyl-CoA-carboxylase] ligase